MLRPCDHPNPRVGARDGCLPCYDQLPDGPARPRDVSGPGSTPDSVVGSLDQGQQLHHDAATGTYFYR